jgi:hypothetical protein
MPISLSWIFHAFNTQPRREVGMAPEQFVSNGLRDHNLSKQFQENVRFINRARMHPLTILIAQNIYAQDKRDQGDRVAVGLGDGGRAGRSVLRDVSER